MQGAFLHPFIKYNTEIRNFLRDQEKIESFTTSEKFEENSKDDTENEAFGLLTVQKLILEKSRNYLSKNEILDYVKQVQNIFENSDNYKDISEIFDVEIEKDISLHNEDSIGTWLNENQNKDYFAEPRYEQESYTTQEYVAAPQKIKKVKKPSSRVNSLFSNTAILSRLASEYQEYEEVEQVLKSVTNYRSVLKGFKVTCSLSINNNEEINTKILLSLKPKNNYLAYVHMKYF
ncbi:hypothetical protein [Acinetobacter bereziniae]|uniref:hypothetical protein n=1 Tax=Acinetobacter bereziniae TaxID=106648 RepID=UPI00111731E2|nr:hypothetical protein [Acinetobacter bereziniae]TNL64910.1 hypothetical protein EYY58_00890 [Acinetobacter bereziniae]